MALHLNFISDEKRDVMFSDEHYNLPTLYMFITNDTFCVNVFGYISILSNEIYTS